MSNKKHIPASAAAYSLKSLKLYNLAVHLISNRFFWKFATRKIHEQYRHFIHLSDHLDIGPGSALFLKGRNLKNVNLLDVNVDVLHYAQTQLEKEGVQVNTIEADLYKALVLDKKYPSIGLSYILHCLAGDKLVVLKNIRSVMADGGVIFGSTILNAGEDYNCCGRKLINIYNKKGIFSNLEDSEESMRLLISSVFPHAIFKKSGHVLLFNATLKNNMRDI